MRRALIVVTALILLAVGSMLALGEALSRPVQRNIGGPPPDLHATTVEIPTTGSDSIAGWFVGGKPGHGAILLLHGVRSDRRQMLGRARFLSRAGYSVLLIDLPGHGESAAERITFGAHESGGVRAALVYLSARLPAERIGVIGVSLGAASFVLAHADPAPSAVVLESMYPTITDAVQDRLAIRLGPLGKNLSPLLLWQLQSRIGVTPDQLRPITKMGDLRVPILIAAGANDRHTPLEESTRIFSAANEPKELWVVQGAAHVDLYSYNPQQYESRVLPFLAKYLLPRTRNARVPASDPDNSHKPNPLHGSG